MELFRISLYVDRWIDQPVLVRRKQNRAIKTMMLRQNLGQHRHRLLTTVFLIRRDQNNMLARTRAGFARVRQP